jgi:hypothetical protein
MVPSCWLIAAAWASDRVGGAVVEQGQGTVLQLLASTGQPRQVLLAQALGQAVQRQGEFDELIEVTAVAVTLPAQLERFGQGDEGMGDSFHKIRFGGIDYPAHSLAGNRHPSPMSGVLGYHYAP